MSKMELSVLKFDFFKVVTDHEHFIPINMPVPYSIANIPSDQLADFLR